MIAKLHSLSRYDIIAKIAAGGMATVYLGALKGPFGFEQLVAIKQLHAHLLDDAAGRESLLMEARTASRIRHVNVVDVRDIEVFDNGVQLILSYVEGASLSTLIAQATRKQIRMPPGIAIRIILDVCAGLHAAHEVQDDFGKPLELVHRDVSPQNVLIGLDGVSRITDFGVARDESSHRVHTRTGSLKGKFAYMAPEYIRGEKADRRVDVFALGVVLWEALSGKRLFRGNNEADTVARVTTLEVPRISEMVPELGDAFDSVFEAALSKDPQARFNTAQALGSALETIATRTKMLATSAEVGQYVRENAQQELQRLEKLRLDAARSSRSNGSIADLPRISIDSIPDSGNPLHPLHPLHSVAHENQPVSAANEANKVEDDTKLTSSSDRRRISMIEAESVHDQPNNAEVEASIICEIEDSPAPHSPTRESGTPIIIQAASVAPPPIPSDFAAPPSSVPPSIEFHTAGPPSAPRSGPPSQMRNLVFRQRPQSIPPTDGIAADHAPMSIPTASSNGAGLDRFVALAERESLTGSNLTLPQQPSRHSSRYAWMVGAFLVFLLSGVGVVAFFGPTASAQSKSEMKK